MNPPVFRARGVHRTLALVVLCLAAACGSEAVDPVSDSADAPALSQAPTDSAEAAALPGSLSVPGAATPGPVTRGGASQAAGDPVLARLDSLQQALRSLQADVRQLRRDTARVTTARADTTTLVDADALRETAESVRDVSVQTILAILLFALAYYFIRGMGWLLEVLAERNAARRLFYKRLLPVIRLATWVVTVYVIISQVYGVDERSLLAAGAALGVAIGFAAQDVLKNVFGGIIIILDQPFQAGDKINVAGTYGEVVSIGLRSTRLVTPDDNLVTVPNAQVVESQVSNANAGALDCQVVTNLYLPGWVDVMRAKRIAYSAAANSKYVYLDKPIVVNVKDEFNGTFLTHLVVKAYVLDTRYEFAFASDVTETAKAEFLKEGMLVPLGTHMRVELGGAPAPEAPSNGARTEETP